MMFGLSFFFLFLFLSFHSVQTFVYLKLISFSGKIIIAKCYNNNNNKKWSQAIYCNGHGMLGLRAHCAWIQCGRPIVRRFFRCINTFSHSLLYSIRAHVTTSLSADIIYTPRDHLTHDCWNAFVYDCSTFAVAAGHIELWMEYTSALLNWPCVVWSVT